MAKSPINEPLETDDNLAEEEKVGVAAAEPINHVEENISASDSVVEVHLPTPVPETVPPVKPTAVDGDTEKRKVLKKYQKQLQIFKPVEIHGKGYDVTITPISFGDIQLATMPDFSDKKIIPIGATYSTHDKDVFIQSGSQSVVEVVYYALG